MTLREELLELSGVLLENKDHLINKLANLSDEEKQKIIEFFHKHPEAESRIDWNRKDLTFADFKKLIDFEGIGRSTQNKNGLPGLDKGFDYDIMESKPGFTVYIPYTYDASRIIASNKVKPVLGNGAKWCTAVQHSDKYWDKYTDGHNQIFAYICDENNNEKWAIQCRSWAPDAIAWDWQNHEQKVPERFEYIVDWIKNNWDKLITTIKNAKKLYGERRDEKRQRWFKNPVAVVKEENGEQVCVGAPSYINTFSVSKIIIPKGVTKIKKFAFSDYKNLETVIIPNTVKEIEKGAFEECKKITNINIPNSVKKIGKGAFSYCPELKKVILPKDCKIELLHWGWEPQFIGGIAVDDDL